MSSDTNRQKEDNRTTNMTKGETKENAGNLEEKWITTNKKVKNNDKQTK